MALIISWGFCGQRSLLGLWLGDLTWGCGRELWPAGEVVTAVQGTLMSLLVLQAGIS